MEVKLEKNRKNVLDGNDSAEALGMDEQRFSSP